MILKIFHYGQKILRLKCQEVPKITPEIIQLVSDMIETMESKNGVGIAAPQVGHPFRIFIARNYIETREGESELSDPKVYINPKILAKSEKSCLEIEGCLSIPGIREEVERPLTLTLSAMDLEGNVFQEELTGYNARVRMHENDHLNGVLFIDRISPLRKKKIAHFLRKIEDKSLS